MRNCPSPMPRAASRQAGLRAFPVMASPSRRGNMGDFGNPVMLAR